MVGQSFVENPWEKSLRTSLRNGWSASPLDQFFEDEEEDLLEEDEFFDDEEDEEVLGDEDFDLGDEDEEDFGEDEDEDEEL